MNTPKILSLSILILIIAACGTAKKAKPVVAPASPPMVSANVRIDPITETRAILKYERGDRIATDGPQKSVEAIAGFCKGKKHKVMVEGERPSGDRKWTKILVFECTD